MSDFAVRPAFTGRIGMLGFALALVAVLAGPYLVHWLLKPDGPSLYRTMPPRYGAYSLVSELIDKGQPIDILIVGSSRSMTALDPVTIERELQLRYGLTLNVVNLSFNWRGDELYYRLAKLVLERLPVGMVVWPETRSTPKRPHPLAHHLWLAPDENLDGAAFGAARRAGLYGAAVLGVPRRVWAAAFPQPEVSPRYARSLAVKREARGFQGERLGWKPKRGGQPAREFVEIKDFPRTEISPAEAIFTGEYSGSFARAKAYSPYQTYFLRRLAELCRQHGARFASIAIPSRFNARELKSEVDVRDLADRLPRTWPLIGISQGKLFEAIDLEGVKAYYKNENHLNLNGARFYSMVVTPALKEVYVNQ